MHKRLPNILLCPVATCMDERIRAIAPVAPNITPKAFNRVIGSFKTMAASTITKIGEAVEIMEASMGEVWLNPNKKSP